MNLTLRCTSMKVSRHPREYLVQCDTVHVRLEKFIPCAVEPIISNNLRTTSSLRITKWLFIFCYHLSCYPRRFYLMWCMIQVFQFSVVRSPCSTLIDQTGRMESFFCACPFIIGVTVRFLTKQSKVTWSVSGNLPTTANHHVRADTTWHAQISKPHLSNKLSWTASQFILHETINSCNAMFSKELSDRETGRRRNWLWSDIVRSEKKWEEKLQDSQGHPKLEQNCFKSCLQ